MLCYRRLLNITFKDPVTNEEVHYKIKDANGKHNDLLFLEAQSQMVRSYLKGLKHGQDNTARDSKKTARRGRLRDRWEENIKGWAGLEFGESVRAVEIRVGWRRIVQTSSVVPKRPLSLRN